jgi:hypothetical protein
LATFASVPRPASAARAQHEGAVLQDLPALAAHHEHHGVPGGLTAVIADQRDDDLIALLVKTADLHPCRVMHERCDRNGFI